MARCGDENRLVALDFGKLDDAAVPAEHPLNEAYQIMEMMFNARSDLLQTLLEK